MPSANRPIRAVQADSDCVEDQHEQGPGQGRLKDIAGKLQEEAGKLVGSTKQQVTGLKNQARGKIQKGVGELKEAAKK